jgi:hypothetical protein
VYILPFQTHFQGFFHIKIPVFYPECQRFAFLVSKIIRFFTLTRKFVLFWFQYFLEVFERNRSYFAFAQSDVRIKHNVSFRYRNELKISLKKRIGFVHVDITSPT